LGGAGPPNLPPPLSTPLLKRKTEQSSLTEELIGRNAVDVTPVSA